MIRQEFNILTYWKVIVYYDIDYNFFNYIEDELVNIGSPVRRISHIKHELKHHAKAVTFSNITKHISLVLFNKHKDNIDYMDSVVHEAEHIKQHILKAYKVKDEGEDAAYTIGYIIKKMLEVKPVKMIMIDNK